MPDTLEHMLGMLLDGAVETLDIAPDLQANAIERYEEVGTWLAERGRSWDIYPQGSFTLGTVVRPQRPTGEYDIDLVCRTLFTKNSISQADLKATVGEQLHAYRRWHKDHREGPPPAVGERRRCWTLEYRDLGFHLDVLPAIADEDHRPTGICLTDRELRFWQHSNPIGYATWFRQRTELQQGLRAAAESKHVNVADVPTWEVRLPLQRVVQVLKWHAAIHFEHDPDLKPPSILITTLTGHAYRGATDLFTATRDALERMSEYIEQRNGRWWVANPAHQEENFTDKWHDHPERREAFWAWHTAARHALDDLGAQQGRGLDAVVASLSEAFAPGPITKSAVKYGEYQRQQRVERKLTVGATGLIGSTGPTELRDHQFYAAHPDRHA